MKRFLQSPLIVSLSGSLVYLVTTLLLLQPEKLAQAARLAAQPVTVPVNQPSWKFRNPEMEQLVAELKQERLALANREQQLHALEARLETERQEILLVTQAVQQLQTNFDKGIVRITQQENENLKHQAKVVSGMSAEGAAVMLNEMTDEQILRILFVLKPDGAAPILEALSKMGKTQAKRAADAAARMRVVLPP
jgi:flagellar motility protein MotE (MotC chaperone)